MLSITLNSIKEFLRNKILYIIVGLAIVLIGLAIVLSQLALSEEKKIILDFSLSVIELFGLITTLFLGSYLLYNEIQRNTILLILSKNPSRSNFLLGKYFSFAFILLLLYIILTIAFVIVVFWHSIPFDSGYFTAIFLSYIKILIVLGFIILFSTFMSPFVTLLVTLSVYIISHMTMFMKFYIVDYQKIELGTFGKGLVNFIFYLFPSFQDLSMKEFLYSPGLSAYTSYHVFLSVGTSIIYIFILLFLAIYIFKKREF